MTRTIPAVILSLTIVAGYVTCPPERHQSLCQQMYLQRSSEPLTGAETADGDMHLHDSCIEILS